MSELSRILRDITKGQNMYSVLGRVQSVDMERRTCTVQPVAGEDDAPLVDVRLQAAVKGQDGFLLVPAENSVVVVSLYREGYGAVVLCSTVDRVLAKVGDQVVDVQESGVVIGKDASAEKAVLGDSLNKNLTEMLDQFTGLLDALDQFMSAQAAAAGAATPTNGLVAAYGAFAPQSAALRVQIEALKQKNEQHLAKDVKLS